MPRFVSTEAAPKAIGPYSQAVVANNMVFCSGQVALDPQTGQLVGSGDVEAETRQVMKNLEQVLKASGATFGNVVKTTILLADMADFATVNTVYGESFTSDPPARATFQVAGLPLGARVEIDAVAVIGG